jgi:hypothetical protein
MFGGRRVTRLAVAAGAALLASGCNDLAEFRTGPGVAYVGEIDGSDSAQSKPSFIREGFASHTQMSLTFDPEVAALYVADAGAHGLASPGTVDTYVCRTVDARCNDRDRPPAEFERAPLELIPKLTHDALSQYDFPGGGRLRNYMFFARTRASDDMPSRAATVFISLMDDGRVEARVIAPSVVSDAGETLAPALFGVFVLERTGP